MTTHEMTKYLSTRPRTMGELVRRFGYAPIVETMREISNTTDTPVLVAPAYDDGQIQVYWIEPKKRNYRWNNRFAKLQADLEKTEVL